MEFGPQRTESMSEKSAFDCVRKLQAEGVSTERARKLALELEEIAGDEDFMDDLKERIREEIERNPGDVDDSIGKIFRGHIFEAYALEHRAEEKGEYAELERFLLTALKDPRIWYMDWESAETLSKEERKTLRTYMNVRPDEEEFRSLRNNDAIAISIQRDEKTDRTIAVITGVVEAKNHMLHSGSDDEAQMRAAPDALYTMVRRFKASYPLIIKGLDLEAILPEEIDILPVEDLSYTIVQPENLRGVYRSKGIPRGYEGCTFEYVPITTKEVAALGRVLRAKLKDELSIPE